MSTTPIVTDAALVAAVADGDMSALRQLYERHGAWLHARLLRRCNDPDVVVEVVQDTALGGAAVSAVALRPGLRP